MNISFRGKLYKFKEKLTRHIEFVDKRHFPPGVDLTLVEAVVLSQDWVDV